jgi:hypothetical protein
MGMRLAQELGDGRMRAPAARKKGARSRTPSSNAAARRSAASAGRRPRTLDPTTLSNIIGSIHDCVVEPKNWQPTLGSIAGSLSFANAIVGVTQLKTGAHEFRVHTGFDDKWLAVVDEYTPDSIRLWGGIQRLQSFPLGEPIVGCEVIAPEEMANSRYYRDILEPRRVIDAVLIALAREPQLVGYLAFIRQADVGYVGKAEVETLRLLAPHLRRAVIISNLLDLQGFQRERSARSSKACRAARSWSMSNCGFSTPTPTLSECWLRPMRSSSTAASWV